MTTSKLIDYDGEKAILGIVTDILKLKKAEEKLNRMMKRVGQCKRKLGVVGSFN